MAIDKNYNRPLHAIPASILSLDDYENLSPQFMSPDVFAYIASGNADEISMQNNRKALNDIDIYNRVLTDCTKGHTQVTLLGETFQQPFLLAPVACQQLVHEQGELATAQAAAVMQVGMITSTLSSYSLEAIAKEQPCNKWFQLYFQEDKDFTLSLVKRAEAAGYTALVVTVDVPISGLRNRAQRAGFVMPSDTHFANLKNMPLPKKMLLNESDSIIFQGVMASAPTWQDIHWLARQTSLPILLKGISHPDDALRAIDIGVAGVVVSNHGGRALDGVPASIHALPAVRHAVGDNYTVLMDGGIRRGTDVFKAIALGANAVLIGRPQVYALAIAGALGVAHMLRLLSDELEITMALASCATIDSINADALFQHNKPRR